jgi:hypothetical protein
MSSRKPIMVVLTGAYGNIGDGVIRRRIFGWVRDLGPVHAYVGNATDDWVEQLGLSSDDRVYRSSEKFAWMQQSLSAKAPAAMILDPGEVPLDRKSLIPEIIFTLLTLIIRLRGGIVVRPPRGVGETSSVTKTVHQVGVASSNVALWRNQKSFNLIKRGELCPDTAFQEDYTSKSDDGRTDLIVSMRGARPYPSGRWFDAIKAIQATYGLRLVVASQVRADEDRSQKLAVALGAEHIAWGTASDLEQEEILRTRYHNAKIVVSDRLHVLILAALAGALPLEIVDNPKDKVAVHFAQIGAPPVSFNANNSSPEEVTLFVKNAVDSLPDLRDAMAKAKVTLNDLEERVRSLVKAAG